MSSECEEEDSNFEASEDGHMIQMVKKVRLVKLYIGY